jgi:hypothetical protein
MTTKKDLKDYAESLMLLYNKKPIFRILMVENVDKELISSTGKHLGWPDMGSTADVGFYYDLDTAVDAVISNEADIRETVYDAAFVLCQPPGLYESVPRQGRMFFKWDPDNEQYIPTSEPKTYDHIAL